MNGHPIIENAVGMIGIDTTTTSRAQGQRCHHHHLRFAALNNPLAIHTLSTWDDHYTALQEQNQVNFNLTVS